MNTRNSDITIRDAVRMGIDLLKENHIENADYDSFALLADMLEMDRTYYFVHGNEKLTKDQMEHFLCMIKQRANHIPLQHILGKAYFYGYEFKVNENVLIPRSDTEILVEEVKKVTDQDSNILDMCTGSGCILLTLACEKHLRHGIGLDISDLALQVAESNKKSLKVDNVEFMQSDVYTTLRDIKYNDTQKKEKMSLFDVIVSNPPYIRSDVIPTLTEEVKNHDPMLALDGFEDGLYFYRIIIKNAYQYLKKGGWLCFEIGYDQSEDVSELMRLNGYTDITTIKDLNGLDRVVKGKLE